MRRHALTALVAIMFTMGITGSAAADSPQNRDSIGRNGKVTISITGDSTRYSVRGYANERFFGHIDIWGPGWLVNGKDGWSPSTSVSGKYGAGKVCAQGFEKRGDGTYFSVGLPCNQVK